MKRISIILAALFLFLGAAQAQDVYFAGNGNDMGKIWKNNTLIYSISDTSAVIINDMKLANDSLIYSTGYSYADFRGHVWMNDSAVFTTDSSTILSRLSLNADGWTTIGDNMVWQYGEILYEYTIDSAMCNLYALDIDTITGDVYAGGSIVTPGVYACVWKNDTILWQNDGWSEVKDLCFDGENLYAAGFVYGAESIDGVVWQNDSIIFQIEDGVISAITAFDGSLYWAGTLNDTAYVWQDGEVLYSHANVNITALSINEYGVYYAGSEDDIATLWEDGEVLYQPEGCQSITAIAVIGSEQPQPTYTLTVMADSTAWGTVTGGGTYYYGDTATIEAFANPGYKFLFWNDSVTDNPRDIVVTQDSTFTALFIERLYTITVISDHPNWGSVTGGGTFYYGDTIQILATPFEGFGFAGWTDGNNDNPRTIIVTDDNTYTAHFEIRQCVITTQVTPDGAGTVNGGGSYNYGSTIQLVAHSNPGYVFDSWDDGNITNPRYVFVDGDATYTAVFNTVQYEITTSCEPEEGGTVRGAGTYDFGTVVSLKADANEGFMFISWQDGIMTNPRNITVTQNAHYKAIFYQTGTTQYTVTVLSSDPELGTVTGGGTYPQGTTIEISATPIGNAIFEGWDDGNIDNPRTVVVTSNMTFKAIFSLTPVPNYTITVRSASPLMGSAYGSGTYPANAVVEIGAAPNSGYYFSGWQDGDMNNPRFITVTENATYTASFSAEPVQTYTVTVYYDENQGFILGAGTYTAGATATLAAIPADGYMFVKWSDDTTDNPKEVLVDQDVTLAAFFNGTGVDEDLLKMASIYPNPTKDKLFIEGLEGHHEVRIYNALGMLVKTESIDGDSEINVSELTTGLYLIRIDNHSTRFVKD